VTMAENLHAETSEAWPLQEVRMKIRRQTYNIMAWGSVLVACIAAIFFPSSRIAGIVALITWAIVIVVGSSRKRRRKQNSN